MGSESLGMSDIERLDKIIASQARTETILGVVQRDVSELKEHTNTRMNAHAASIRVLNKTRDRQWGQQRSQASSALSRGS